MRLRLLIAAQTGVMFGLIGLVIFQSRQLRLAQQDLQALAEPLPELPTGTNPRPVRLRPQQLPPLTVRPRIQDLDWRSVESADYATYVANLRRIGCPEETIRDIILADINQLYESRRQALQEPPADWEFWRHPDERTPGGGDLSEAEKQRDAAYATLERDRRRLIVTLLGSSALQAEWADFKAEELRDRSLQFLPPEKRDAVAEALAHWRQAREESRGLTGETEVQAALESAERTLDAALASALTPDELRQYELRTSPRADALRERLRGFGASREEFEQLYEIERRFDAERAALAANPEDPQLAARLEANELERERAIQETLTPQRLSDLQRARDPDYQTLFTLALDHDVPPSVASDVWEMRRAVLEQTDQVRDNPLLTLDQKQRALEAIRRETQSAIVDVLGEPLLEDYQREGGWWLEEFTSPAGLVEALPDLDLELDAPFPPLPGVVTDPTLAQPVP